MCDIRVSKNLFMDKQKNENFCEIIAFNLKQMKAHDCWLKIVPWQVNDWTWRLNKERGNDSFESFHLRDFALQSLVRVSSVFLQDGSTIVSTVPTEALFWTL